MPKKRKTPRRLPELHCSGRTKAGGPCRNPIRFERWCHRHAIKEADRVFSIWIRRVRDKRCQVCSTDADLQCAHVFSRGYHALRWTPEGALCLCAGHHKWFTHAPLEWEDWCRERMGSEQYDRLRLIAVRGGMPDVAWTILNYRRLLDEAGERY